MNTFEFDHYAIRLVTATDAVAFFNLIENNRARLEDYFSGTVARTHTLDQTQLYVTEIMGRIEAQTYFPYFIIDRELNAPIGWVDVKNIDWNIPKAELGCFMDKDHTGKSIAHKAMIALIEHLFHDHRFNKLFLRTSPNNADACALAERCGFEVEGVLRKDYKTTRGELVDLRYYGLINSSKV
jgi:ribosomal-protein-serine acetyltransferase